MLALSAPAAAQRAIVFGDSLSDNGNLAGFGAFPYPAPPYYTGTTGLARFSNGPVWSEQLFGTLGQPYLTGNTAGNVDLAFGGSRTDNAVALPPGLPAQVQTFLALGGTFGPNDTIVAWGGANNIFQYFGPPALGPLTSDGITANSVAAATSMTNSVLAPIILAGGKTILVPNLPDLGLAPAYNGSATSSSAGTLATLTYNNALTSGVRALAAANPGVNLIQADVMAAFRVILANPSAFGFSNVTQACVSVAACVGGSLATQNSFLFWDTVHPTEAGHALLATYFGLLLNTAPAIASTQPLGEIGHLSATLVSNAAFDRMSNWMTGVYAFKNGPYVEALGQIGNYDEQIGSGTARYHLNLGGARMGYDRAFGNALAGFSATFLTGDQSSPGFKNDIMTVHGNAYGTYVAGPFYASADAGISHLWLDDIQRDTGFPTVTAKANTTGLVGHVAGEVGMMQRLGPIAIIPSGRIRYIHSSVAGYVEQADLLALQFEDRTSSMVLASGRVRAVTQVQIGAFPTSVFGEVGYEALVSSDNDGITARLVNNTALPTIVNPGDPNGQGILGKVGFSSQVKDTLYVDMSYGITVHDGGGETHALDARLKAHF